MKKNKRMKKFFLFIALIFLSTSAYFLYISNLKLNKESISLSAFAISELSELSNETPSLYQYYNNMRFSSRNISYRMELCSQEQKQRMYDAFKILENKTVLSFYETKSSENIYLSCNQTSQLISENFLKAGEGGAFSIIDTGSFNIIKKGKVVIFNTGHGNSLENKLSQCQTPVVELHELLHVLGFKHSGNNKSLLYNITSCDQEIEENITKELIRLYTIEELPDLAITSLSYSRHQDYVDFKIEILNKGLKLSENSELELNSDSQKIRSFNLENIDYGEGRFLHVENLLVGSSTKLDFVVKAGKELSNLNNMKQVSL